MKNINYWNYTFPIIYCILAALSSKILPFINSISVEALTYSLFDTILSIFLVLIFLARLDIITITKYLKHNIIDKLNNYWIITLVLSLISLYYAKNTILGISLGITREDLVADKNINYFMLFSSPFFKVLVPLCFFLGCNYKLKLSLAIGLLSCLLYNASMAELLYIGFILLTLITILNKRIKPLKTIIAIIIIIALSFIVAKYAQTVRYGGNIDIYDFIISIVEKIFKYRAFSFYLSDILLNLDGYYYKILYPFIGYPSEWIISIFYSDINYFDSSFLTKYHYLGGNNFNPYLANVIYPWWSFFVFSFGFIGIIIKFIWCYFLLFILKEMKLYITLIYFISLILYIGQFTFPFISINAIATLLTLIALDVIFKLKLKPYNKKTYKI